MEAIGTAENTRQSTTIPSKICGWPSQWQQAHPECKSWDSKSMKGIYDWPSQWQQTYPGGESWDSRQTQNITKLYCPWVVATTKDPLRQMAPTPKSKPRNPKGGFSQMP